MVAVWMGTQADEAFTMAWHVDVTSVYGKGVFNVKSKVYVSPKLWHLRVNVTEADDVVPSVRSRQSEVLVKAHIGNQVMRTTICLSWMTNLIWNENLVFVVVKPVHENLVLTFDDQIHHSKDDVLRSISIPLDSIEKRLNHRPVNSRCFNLDGYGEGDRRRETKFWSMIHLRVCLEGGYHVLDESTMYISDQRPGKAVVEATGAGGGGRDREHAGDVADKDRRKVVERRDLDAAVDRGRSLVKESDRQNKQKIKKMHFFKR